MSTWSREPENTSYIDPKEMAERVDNYGEVIDLLRAESLFKVGNRNEAMRLFDSSISKGLEDAKIGKGLAMAEGALQDGRCEDMIEGLKLAMPVAMRLMQPAQGRRLLKILQMAVDAGWIQGDSQFCLDVVNHEDVYDRMEDFVRAQGNEKASLSNLYECLNVFYR